MKENKKMVNPAVNSVPDVDDGVCEGEYRHPYPTQEEIIAFNRKEYSASIHSGTKKSLTQTHNGIKIKWFQWKKIYWRNLKTSTTGKNGETKNRENTFN